MHIKRKIHSLLFLIMLPFFLLAQDSHLSFSRQQMYEDFDQLVEIVQQYNPQIGVRKEVTGYDVIERMLQMRSNIEDIQSNADFYEFLSKVLANQIDMHSYMINYMVPKRVYHQFLSNTFF